MDLEALEADLRAQALAFPETSEHFPWGERVVKVGAGANPKVFVFLSHWKDGFNVTLKLPQSRDFALMFEPCTPSGHNLGKSGWVTTRLFAASDFDTDLLGSWLEESYRAIAPKRLVKAHFGA
ncbi:MAG: MmcQ/YjbR family DNA-binding protein [Thermaurantiacus sp.]